MTSNVELRAEYDRLDTNGDGVLNKEEFIKYMTEDMTIKDEKSGKALVSFSQEEAERAFKLWDQDETGKFTFEEFEEMVGEYRLAQVEAMADMLIFTGKCCCYSCLCCLPTLGLSWLLMPYCLVCCLECKMSKLMNAAKCRIMDGPCKKQ